MVLAEIFFIGGALSNLRETFSFLGIKKQISYL
jgi:hypothetical protein